MNCPRCNVPLNVEKHRDIEVDHCGTCNGRWLDHEELDHLEATVPSTEAERVGTIEYARRDSELLCPKCGNAMRAFNYRAYNLELDTCGEQHGFWLDAGEEGRVRDIIEERVKGLQRAASAEQAWGSFLEGLGGRGRGGGSVFDSIKRMFGGR
jgi:Zn-finger nucleic acid-binding protein